MKNNILKMVVLFLGILLLNACTVYDNPEPYFEDNEVVGNPYQRKVLIISIDGLSGRELQKAIPSNIGKLIKSSKYTFNSLSDEASSGASTWTSMMTGVHSKVHKVNDDTFQAKADPNDQHAAIPFHPTFFYRMLFTKPDYNTVIISPWENLVSKLLIEVETQIVSTSDESSKDKAVEQLSDEDPEVMIVNFRDVETAGESSGYDIDNPEYLNAINKTDEYIGDLLSALKARANYEKEEWLIILTSNHGGSIDGSSGSDSFDDRNTFTLLHYKNFKEQEINPSLIGSSNFTQLASSEASYSPTILEATNTSEYNFSDNEMSVEFKFKRNAIFSWNGQPFILGKTLRYWSHASGTGWAIGTQNDKLQLYLTFDNNQAVDYSFNTSINDLKWHHFAFSVKKISSSSVIITLFADGISVGSHTVTMSNGANPKMSSAGPLFIGVRRSHNGNAFSREDVNMADVRIYNKSITTKEAERLSCIINTISTEEPLYENLVANFELKEIVEGEAINGVEGKPNVRKINSNLPKTGKSLISTRCNAEDRGNILITNVDITTMTLYWLRITPDAAWKLSGNKVIDQFEEEFVNQKK